MIRVSIVADRPERSWAIAELLAEEDRIEVIGTGTIATWTDVVICAGPPVQNVPPDACVVFLSDDEPVRFEPEGRAWLPLNATAAELSAAISAAAQDLTVLTARQSARWLPGRTGDGERPTRSIEPLTNREMQVLRMLANGLGNKEIAHQLGISEHTAKFHVAQILGKLGASSRAEAVMLGIRQGLLPI